MLLSLRLNYFFAYLGVFKIKLFINIISEIRSLKILN